jgi:DNA-binding beta-propeller fold protein YncE
VADTNNSRIVRFGSSGTVLSQFPVPGTKASKPQGIAVDTDGSLLVSNTGNNAVQRYSTSGALQGTVAGSATVKSPSALLVTGTGADKKIWIADTGNNRVVVLGESGSVLKTFGGLGSGDGKFNTPRGVAVDPTDGDIAVADYLNNRVSIWEPTGPPVATDTAAPTLSVSSPAAGATIPSPVTITGTATDDLQVASVTLSIKRASDNQWWNGTVWQSTFASVAATLDTPGASSSGWSYALSAAGGKYGFSATVTDGAGKTFKSTWRNFTVLS